MSLHIENLDAGYGKTTVLRDINCKAGLGEIIGLLGPNGSGKSCLLKTIAGLVVPTRGGVVFNGKAVTALSPKIRARNIAWLAQDRSAAWALSVRELVSLGRAPYRGRLGKLSQTDERAVDVAMASAHCTDLQNRHFNKLSGGEQARALLARALAVEAPVLLADEPTASLDPYYQISILQSLAHEAKTGKTVIVSLHDLALAKQFCHRVWVMNEGRLVANDMPQKALRPTLLADVFRIKIKNGFTVQIPEKS